MKDYNFKNLFLVGIIIKGVDGCLEIFAGLLLFFIKSSALAEFVKYIFHHELVQDPTDFIANYLVNFTQNISSDALIFTALYLMTHGAIKIIIVLGLWYDRLWTHLVAGILLILAVIYQIRSLFVYFTMPLLFFTLIDIIILMTLIFNIKEKRFSKSLV